MAWVGRRVKIRKDTLQYAFRLSQNTSTSSASQERRYAIRTSSTQERIGVHVRGTLRAVKYSSVHGQTSNEK